MGSIRRKTHPALPQHNTNSEDTSGAMEEMLQKVQKANTLHHICRSSCDVQPNQLGRPTRLYIEDPAPTLGIEHHTSGHLRLDSQRAVDADRRPTTHVASQVVRARRHQDLVDRAVADGGGELSYGAQSSGRSPEG